MEPHSNDPPPGRGRDGRPFRNLRPKTRTERLNLLDKASREKANLRARWGYEAKAYRANVPEGGSSGWLTSCGADGAGFASDSDRFHSDTTGDEKQVRGRHQQMADNRLQGMRDGREAREEQRWKKADEAEQAETEFWERQRELGEKSKKNASAVPYHPITMAYHPTPQGATLQFEDEKSKWRAKLRADNMTRHGGTRCGYDILNGMNAPGPTEPERPAPPADLVAFTHARRQGGAHAFKK